MTGANAKIKRIMIGDKKVRPVLLYEYEYTFKGKTTTQISNEFTLYTGVINTNSDGVCGNSSTDCRIGKTIPSLSTAKRIIIDGTVVVNSRDVNSNAAMLGLSIGSGWGTGFAGNRIEGSTYGGCNVTVKTNNTVVNGSEVGNTVQGTYTSRLVIDLDNKKLTGSVSGFNDSTLTLTDAQITEIRTFTYLLVYVSCNNSAISDVSIKIY